MTASTSRETPPTEDTGRERNNWKWAAFLLALMCAFLASLLWLEHSKLGVISHEKTTNFDHKFIDSMIPHEQQAIDEATLALTKA